MKAVALMALLATAATDPRVPIREFPLGRGRARRAKESIDDVLDRAKARRGKAWFDPKADGKVRPLHTDDFNELSLSRMPPGFIRTGR